MSGSTTPPTLSDDPVSSQRIPSVPSPPHSPVHHNETYYLARPLRSSSNALQVQRIFNNAHTDIHLDIRVKQKCKSQLHDSLVFETSHRTSSDFHRTNRLSPSSSKSSLTVGSRSPSPSINSETFQHVSAAHSPTSSSVNVFSAVYDQEDISIAEFSKYGVAFKETSTPALSSGRVIRSFSSDHGPDGTIDSAKMKEPVIWLLIPDGSGYNVFDQSTKVTIGRWTRRGGSGASVGLGTDQQNKSLKKRKSSFSSSVSGDDDTTFSSSSSNFSAAHVSDDIWSFVSKGKLLATLHKDNIIFNSTGSSDPTYIDEFTRKLRVKHLLRSSSFDSAPVKPKRRISQSIYRSTKNQVSQVLPCNYISPSFANQNVNTLYRTRFIDGLMLSSLSLILALSDHHQRSSTAQSLIQSSKTPEKILIKKPSKLVRAFSSVKSALQI